MPNSRPSSRPNHAPLAAPPAAALRRVIGPVTAAARAGGRVGRGRGVVEAVERVLADLHQHQVDHDDPGQGEEERARQGLEAQEVGQVAGVGQHRADDGYADRSERHRRARDAADERDRPGADHEDDQGLGGQGLHEPAGLEQGRAGVEHPQHDAEGGEVEQGADRAEEDHELADEADVPAGGLGDLFRVDVVGGDDQLAAVIQQVVEQDLRGQHGQELQEDRCPGRAEHVPEVVDVPISTYFIVLAKIRRPPTTPSASTFRPFSSSSTSAASLATSVAELTEMPTSAVCSATAGQTQSSRSRICCTWLVASMISCSRCTPSCRNRAHVSSTGSGS
jgi:hypothetical protein